MSNSIEKETDSKKLISNKKVNYKESSAAKIDTKQLLKDFFIKNTNLLKD